jgi:hypothetical protein
MRNFQCAAFSSDDLKAMGRTFRPGVLGGALGDLRSRSENHDILEPLRLHSEPVAQQTGLCVVRVWGNHRRELGLVVERRAVMEDDGCERTRQHVHASDGHAGHLDDAA